MQFFYGEYKCKKVEGMEYLLSAFQKTGFPVGENMSTAMSMSHNTDISSAFLTSPFFRFE